MTSRRQFIALIGGAGAWPVAAQAQQVASSVVGYLSGRSAEADVPMLAAFRKGLAEAGYIDGRNIRIERRFAEGRYDRLPALAEDLVGRQVAVIATGGGIVPATAAKAATVRIPIVFNIADDPVRAGLVESLNRPGRNLTGVTTFQTALMAKQIGLLSELLAAPATVALLIDPQAREAEAQSVSARTAAAALGHRFIVVNASNDSALSMAFAEMAQKKVGAILVGASPFFVTRSKQVVEQAARHALPAMYFRREFVEAGGLMSYGSTTFEMYHQMAVYVGRILKGASPGDLPVWQPTKFELAINLRAAKAIGMVVPDKLMALADEVIE